jgi:hypothetical protein
MGKIATMHQPNYLSWIGRFSSNNKETAVKLCALVIVDLTILLVNLSP